MTRGDKYVQDMVTRGLDEEQLRRFVETGNCVDFDTLFCTFCPFGHRTSCPNNDVANYFKEEIKEETK